MHRAKLIFSAAARHNRRIMFVISHAILARGAMRKSHTIYAYNWSHTGQFHSIEHVYFRFKEAPTSFISVFYRDSDEPLAVIAYDNLWTWLAIGVAPQIPTLARLDHNIKQREGRVRKRNLRRKRSRIIHRDMDACKVRRFAWQNIYGCHYWRW